MTRPERFLTRMALFLVVVIGVAVLLFPALENAFMTNPALNGLILTALLIGIVFIFRQVLILRPELAWLEHYQAAERDAGPAAEPVLLAPLARMLGDRKKRLQISALSMRSVLDGLAARLDESRELSRYLIGLLIFLGLLGTFWGLLHTVRSVGAVIGELQVQGGADVAGMFAQLKQGLELPLTGMGTAFSASLFGLAGSLVLGFLELQATQAQHRFFQDVEDWLSGGTRLSSGVGGLETGDQSMPAYVQALLEQTAENLDSLQRTVAGSEEGRRSANASLMALTERLTTLTDQMRAEQQLLLKLAESQMEMKHLLTRMTDVATSGFGMDEASRQHLRNMDVYLARLVEEASNGRTQAVSEIRSEIKILTRTIAALAEEQEPR